MNIFKKRPRVARRALALTAAAASLAALGTGVTPAAQAVSVESWRGAGTAYFYGSDGNWKMLEATLESKTEGDLQFALKAGNYHVGPSDFARAQDVIVTFQLQQASPTDRTNWHNIAWAVTQKVRLNRSSAGGVDMAGPTFPVTHRFNAPRKAYRFKVTFLWTLPGRADEIIGKASLSPSMTQEFVCPPGTIGVACTTFEDDNGTGNSGMVLGSIVPTS